MKGSAIRTRGIERALERLGRLPGLIVSDGERTTSLNGDVVTMWTITNELNVDTEPLVLALIRPAGTRKHDRIECTLTSRGEEVNLRTEDDLERLVALWRLRGVEGAELVDTLTLPGWKQLALFPLDEAGDVDGGEAA